MKFYFTRRGDVFFKLQLVPAAFIAVDRHTVAQYAAQFSVTYNWVPVTDKLDNTMHTL
jgi:hypothetical protein